MPLEVRCPNPKCGCLLKASTLAEGKQIPCPKCGAPITVPDVSKDDTLMMSGSPSDSLIGRKLAHYEIISELGSGGMGVVYKARNVSLDKIVAIKVLPEYISAHDRELLARFIREARSAAKLEHPNITPVYFAGRIGKRYFIEMQYVEGKSLAELVEKKGRFTPAAATRIVEQTARALKVAHENGIIHRDVKPSNIILDRNGAPKVTDFGLAKVAETETGVTASGQVLGTPDYMSPEQSRGEDVDKRSDIYSLGATYYMLLTGKTLFKGKTVMQVLLQHVDTPPPSPRETVPDLPECVCAIVAKMLAKKPEERHQNCDELIAELQAVSQSLAAAPAPVEKKTSRLPYAVAAGFAIAAIAGGAALFLIECPGPTAPGPQPGQKETHSTSPPRAATDMIPKPVEPLPPKGGAPEPTPAAAKIEKPVDASPPKPVEQAAPDVVAVPPKPESVKQTPAEQPPPPGQPAPEAAPFDAAAYARDTKDVDELIDQLDLQRAHIRALELVPKYPKPAVGKAENIKRLEEFLDRIFARISSGEICAEMKDLSRRFAYAGRISRIDMRGVAAQDGKFEKEWKHFKREELYQLLRKCLGETVTSTDRASLAILLAEGTPDETCLALAEDEIAKADKKDDDVQRAIATVGLAREVLSARAARPQAAPAAASAPAASGRKDLVERLVPENRPLAGNLLLHETFDDNTRLWEQTEKESNRCMVEKGVYHLQSRESGPARLRGAAIAHKDVILHASVRLAALDDPERSRFGLCIRRGRTGPFYIFTIAPTQCSLDKIKPSVTGSAATETFAANPRVKTKDLVGKTVEMEILAAGPAFRCYLDGERVLDAIDPDPVLEGERIEVCLTGNLDVVVDDVILFDLQPSAAKPSARAAPDAQAAAMERVKDLKKCVEKELNIELATVETGHFILHGDLPKGRLEGVGKAGEKAYARLCSVFNVEKKQPLRPGKYAVFLFASKEEYRNYLTKVCHVAQADQAGLVSSPLPPKAGCAGFAGFSVGDSSDDLTGTYYWFLSTDFLRGYKQGAPLPAWMEAGFREHCKRTMAGDPTEPKRTRTEVKLLAQRGEWRGLKDILAAKEFPPSDESGRYLCFSLVDYAVSRGPKQFVEFVDKIKDGADQETALREVFGRPLDEFEAGWKAFVDKKY
ncbi:MAG: protein kinase [Planctomycetota bacterium]